MERKVNIVLASLVGLSLVLQGTAQNPDSKRIDHWYFGQGAGLDFSSGMAIADTTGAMHVWKGSTTMSDTAGNLLFYSDGRHVWNAQHDTMPNGDIWGIPPGVFPQDCAIAVPKPGDDNIYYIFTSDGYKLTQQNGLQYHIIDMSLNGGLGDVVQKNIPLYNPVTEQLCAVRHGNNCDYWLITHEKHTENYLAFHINGFGVDPSPVVSADGISNAPWTAGSNEYEGAIILKASPQGDKLASIIYRRWQNTGLDDLLQLSSFDHTTGEVSNSFLIELDSTFSGTSFSPDGSIFYCEYGSNSLTLDQFDMTFFDSVSVNASRLNIWTSTTKNFATDLAIGNDGKLYGCNPWGYVLNIDSIPVIHDPNVFGPGCMIDEWGVGLHGRFSDFVMPEMVADFSAPQAPEYCSTGFAEQITNNALEVWVEGDALVIRPTGTVHTSDYNLKIYNSAGKLCASTAIRLEPDHAIRYDLGTFHASLYLLELTAPGQPRYAQPFVKPQ